MSALPIEQHWVQRAGTRISRVVRPTTFENALIALSENPLLRPVAGGTDLILELERSGDGNEVELLDLSAIIDLTEIRFDNPSGVYIGAGVTHADIVGWADSVEHLFPLAQACLEIGSPQLRNRATIVGNLVTASPANDTISALLALDAQVAIASYDAGVVERKIPLADFYTGFRTTILEPTDLVQGLWVPHATPTQRGIWVKAGLRKAQAISVVHAGLVLQVEPDGIVTSARIALGSVGPVVELNGAAAEVLVGSALDRATIAAAAAAAADSVAPIDDGRATADYRRDSVRVVVSRALTALANGQERSQWPARGGPALLSTRSAGAVRDAKVVTDSSEISVHVNGTTISARAAVAPSGTLLDWLRETTGTGTKEGCAEGECGACTVEFDGDAVMSCLVLAAQADGGRVTTIEGLAPVDSPNTMQQAFVDKFAVQCGYCIPGFVMAAQSLADELGAVPTRDEIELALSGNLCRCTGYYNIIAAVIAAIESERA